MDNHVYSYQFLSVDCWVVEHGRSQGNEVAVPMMRWKKLALWVWSCPENYEEQGDVCAAREDQKTAAYLELLTELERALMSNTWKVEFHQDIFRLPILQTESISTLSDTWVTFHGFYPLDN